MLTPRLLSVKNKINHRAVSDIGTDHAYIPISLIDDNICDKVIATDIREGPLNIAVSNIKKHGYSDKIETRLGSGLSVIKPNETDQIIIAGMGGFMIKKIIEEDKETATFSELILQPMNCQYELRKFLIFNNYTITEEDIAVEGKKVYNIICVKYGKQKPFENEILYHLPLAVHSHPLFLKLKEKKKREFTKILFGQRSSSSPDLSVIQKYEYLLNELNKI